MQKKKKIVFYFLKLDFKVSVYSTRSLFYFYRYLNSVCAVTLGSLWQVSEGRLARLLTHKHVHTSRPAETKSREDSPSGIRAPPSTKDLPAFLQQHEHIKGCAGIWWKSYTLGQIRGLGSNSSKFLLKSFCPYAFMSTHTHENYPIWKHA